MALDDVPSKAIAEVGKIANSLGAQPPEARLLTFGIATMIATIPIAIFSSMAISFGLLAFALLMAVLYMVVLRANREPPRIFKNQYDTIYQEYGRDHE